jgi:MFS family permease
MGHNVLFFYVPPRVRVLISMTSMALSMTILTGIFFILDHQHLSLAWVFLAYGFGGLGIGTFESNLLSCISPLGKTTKFWAILGMPIGINLITVGGFLLLEAGVSAGYIYFGVMIFVLVGIALFLVRIYRESGVRTAITLIEFIYELRQWKSWFPHIQWHCLALMVDMFCVSMFSPGVMLYIYDSPYVSFPWFRGKLKKDYVFSIYDTGFFIGDTLSRKIFYPRKIVFPLFFWVFAIIGVACGLSNVSELIFFCGFLVAFCNGSIYAQANRKIDSTIDKKHSLIAFSCWLFVGDIGSVLGSNLISYVSVAVKKGYHGS